MSAFFFGPPEAPLFGYHHDARYGATGAAVLCAPWGSEYQYSHRALRVLGRRLAARGIHALRFDYRGTGDSWGDTTDGTVAGWIDDIGYAVDKAHALTGAASVHLIGLRVGALFAATLAARHAQVGKLVLWDPVPDAAEWLDSLGQPNGSWRDASGPSVELDGQLVAHAMLSELRECTLASVARGLTATAREEAPALVLETQGATAALAPGLADWPQATLQRVDDEAPWREDRSIWSGLVPSKAIGTIVEWIAT